MGNGSVYDARLPAVDLLFNTVVNRWNVSSAGRIFDEILIENFRWEIHWNWDSPISRQSITCLRYLLALSSLAETDIYNVAQRDQQRPGAFRYV